MPYIQHPEEFHTQFLESLPQNPPYRLDIYSAGINFFSANFQLCLTIGNMRQ